mgnify:CR=1 FL=1
MKVFYNDLLNDLDTLDRDFSILVTIAEGSTDWNSVPNSTLEIIKERIRMLNAVTADLYELLEKHPR